MELAASSSGVMRRDRAASGGIFLEAGGECLWPAEMTADAHIEDDRTCLCYLLCSLRRDSSDEMESCTRGGAKFPSLFSTSWVDQISVDCNDMSCHDMFSVMNIPTLPTQIQGSYSTS